LTLIGFTEQRGHAWHYRAGAQGEEPNHYPELPAVGIRRIGATARPALGVALRAT